MKSLKKYVPEECSCIEITNKAYFCVHRVLIYVFHTHFVRGAKVRLFCSPHWWVAGANVVPHIAFNTAWSHAL